MPRLLSDEEIEKHVRSLPVAPAVLSRLHAMLQDEGTNTIDLIEVVRTDPALSAAVVRLARSPLYHRSSDPETLDESLVRLGFAELTPIVSYTVMRQLATPLPAYGESVDSFWKKSVACALAMELLAEQENEPCDRAYLVGLPHAIGEILLQRILAVERENQIQFQTAAGPSIEQQEQAALGVHQGEAAARALRYWHFTENVVLPIEFQFTPPAAKSCARTASRLAMAKWVSLWALGEHDRARVLNPDAEFLLADTESRPSRLLAALQEKLPVLDVILQGFSHDH